MRKLFPTEGRSRDAVLADLAAMKSGDSDWRHGRVPLFVFKASEAVRDIGAEAFMAFFDENALGGKRAFPSVKRMEDEVVGMALDLFRAPEDGQGFMTTGGTESIVLAVQCCRDWSRAARGDPRHRGNIVCSEATHPAFDKAGRLMDLEVRRVPVGADYRADPAALEAALDADTIMLVASAPSFPFGMIDPVTEIAAVAERRGIWLHVDACVGGYLAPFVRAIGRDIPEFDFAIPGVSSLSADLHKFGFTPKPASTVLYRRPSLAGHQGFDGDVWPSGRFTTATIVGTRPAGGVAAAWATLNHLGRQGYERIAGELMAFVDRYKAGIRAIDGLEIIGAPHLSLVAYGSTRVDIFRVAELMSERGWVPGLLQRPKAIHRMMSLLHEPSLEAYLADLRAAVTMVKAEQSGPSRLSAQY